MATASEALQSASLALTRSLDLESVLETLLDYLAELVPYDSANVMLADDGSRLSVRALRGYESWADPSRTRVIAFDARTNPIVESIFRRQEALLIPDTRAHPHWQRPPGAEHVLCWIGVPLSVAGSVMGIFSLDKAAAGFFTEEHRRLAESLAPQAALAIQNARLHAAERAARAEAERLESAARALGASLDPGQVFAAILGELRALIPYDSATVMELDGGRMKIVGGHGFADLPGVIGVSFDLSADNPNREVARTLAPVILDDAPSRFPAFKSGPHAVAPVRSWLGVPLLFGGRLIGMLALDKCDSGFFGSGQARLVTSFAAQAAIAMENARLYASARRELAERERAEARHRAFVEEAPYGLVAVDRDQRIVLLNREAERLFGYPRAEILGQSVERLVPEGSRGRLRDLLSSGSRGDAGDRPAGEAPPRLLGLRRDGVEFPMDASVGSLEIEGAPLVVAALLDVTESARAEEGLRASEARYRSLFHSHPLPIWVYDIETLRFLAVNDVATLAYGWSREEFLGMTVRDIRPPDDLPRFEGLVAELRERSGYERSTHWRHLTRDGRLREVEIVSHDIEFEGRPARIVAVHDVTEKRELEARFRQAQKLEAVGQLAGGIAHDFNNMLGVILGFAQLALRRLEPAHPVRHNVERIIEAAERSAGLTRQLLAFARRQTIAPRVLDLNEEIASLTEMLGRLVGEDVRLEVIPGAGLWKVKLDPVQLGQVLANLASNARDAIEDVGTITIETANTTLDESAARTRADLSPGDYVQLAFRDSGAGMDATTRGRIFEPFFTTKAEGRGTGLGLATVFGIVKQNGGLIDVASAPGRGTTFRIYLPRCRDERAAAVGEKPRDAGGGRETLLLVEDEPQLLELAREALAALGYTVLSAASPADALRLCEGHPGRIDLLVTDVVMPGMNGRQLRERIQRLRPGLRVLFMSGYAADAIAHRGVLEGGVRFIEKPFSLDALGARVREALEAS